MPKALATVLFVLLVAAAAYWLFMPRDRLETVQQTPAPTTAPTRQTAAAPTPSSLEEPPPAPAPDTSVGPDNTAEPVVDDTVVPPPPQLDASDVVVMAAVSQLNPEVAQWLLPDDQIRKWVSTINLLADGKFPVKDRPLEAALPPFQVRQFDERLWVHRGNHRRASVLVKALTRMPPSRVAKHYAAWRPLLEQAQDELGNGKQFDERLHTAIARVLAVPPLTGEIEVRAGVLKYTYADERMEQASALEKALWRLGPANTLRVQNYLRALQPLL